MKAVAPRLCRAVVQLERHVDRFAILVTGAVDAVGRVGCDVILSDLGAFFAPVAVSDLNLVELRAAESALLDDYAKQIDEVMAQPTTLRDYCLRSGLTVRAAKAGLEVFDGTRETGASS